MERGWLDAVTHLYTLANAQIRPDPYLGSVFLIAAVIRL